MTESATDRTDLAMWRHDVRNKLNIITGYAALLRIDDLSDHQREFITEIEKAAREIQSLVDAMRTRILQRELPIVEEVRLDE
jgi:signal transduction histidine kinase